MGRLFCRLGWHRWDTTVTFVFARYEECSRCRTQRQVS